MKNLKFFNVLCVTVIIFSTIHAAECDFEGYTFLECELRVKERGTRKHFDEFKLTDEQSAYASFTHPHIPLVEGTSQNWSGYVAVTNLHHPASQSINAIYGSWIVPKLSAASHDNYCSLWVGIDGYDSSTVEQIGTEHDWHNGKQTNYAWFEMYPNASYEIVGFPADPGDSMSASVVYQGNGIFLLTIANNTRKVHTTIPTSYTTSHIAQRISAEWVMEAPYLNGILPLSHFNVAYFSNCTATFNTIHGPINDHFWADNQLTMVTSSGNPKAIPSSLSSNGQSFSVLWKHE